LTITDCGAVFNTATSNVPHPTIEYWIQKNKAHDAITPRPESAYREVIQNVVDRVSLKVKSIGSVAVTKDIAILRDNPNDQSLTLGTYPTGSF
jgi:hypothetical protein